MMPTSEPEISRAVWLPSPPHSSAPLPEGEVGVDDVARQVERHGEAELGDRLGEDRAGRHHMDAALEQHVVGHVVDEIGLDIEDAAQRRHALERLARRAAAGRRCSGPRRADRRGSAAMPVGVGLDDAVFSRGALPAPSGVKIRSSVRGSGALMTSGLALSGMCFLPGAFGVALVG